VPQPETAGTAAAPAAASGPTGAAATATAGGGDGEYGPPWNKKPPPGLDMFGEIAWKKRQKEAKQRAESEDSEPNPASNPAATAAAATAGGGDGEYGPPWNKKPPPGLGMFEEIAWKNRQKEAQERAESGGPEANSDSSRQPSAASPNQPVRRRLVLGGEEVQFAHARFGASKCELPDACTVAVDPIRADDFLRNVVDIQGNVAVVERGGASFAEKAMRAQNAGALACLFVNTDDELWTLGGDADDHDVTLPVVSLNRLLDESPWLQCTSECQRF
jgi:hypothetical protein